MPSRQSPAAPWIVALGLGLAATASNAFELRGFRGVDWGEAPQVLGVATVAHADGDVTCYQRERENLLLGDSALNDVRYCFHQNRLFMVALDAAVAQKALVAEFQRAYGRPSQRSGQAASWGGHASATRAELASQGPSAARLTLYSNQIEPALAQRMHRLAGAPVTLRMASGS